MFSYNRLEQLMKESSITPYKLSKMTGISESALSNWKNGKYNPSLNHLTALAKFFEKPIEYFL